MPWTKNNNQKPREVRVPLLLPSLLLAGAKTRTSKRILPRLLVFSFVTIVNTLFKLHSAAAPPIFFILHQMHPFNAKVADSMSDDMCKPNGQGCNTFYLPERPSLARCEKTSFQS